MQDTQEIQCLKDIKSEMSYEEVHEIIIGILRENVDDQQKQDQLLDILGYDNIEPIFTVIQNQQIILNAYKSSIKQLYQKQSEESQYEDVIELMREITKWNREEVIYHLNRYHFDVNEALDQFYSTQKRFTISVGEEASEYSYDSMCDEDNVEQISNVQIIDDTRIHSFTRSIFSLDLHGYGYAAGIEAVRNKVNDMVRINMSGQKRARVLHVITGRGVHSEKSPLLKLGVIKMFQLNGISFYIDPASKGGKIVAKISSNQHML